MPAVPATVAAPGAGACYTTGLMKQHGPTNPAPERAMTGIGLGLLAYMLFSAHDATIKLLVASLPVWQVLFVRSLVIVLAALTIGRTRLVEQMVHSKLKRPLLLRGALTLTAWLMYYTAARSLPLAQLMTLYFAAPLMVTILAAPLLGEVVTRGRWIAVGVGFVGVLVASDPLGLRLSLATVLVLAAAGMWGYGVVLMRQIARRESSLLQILVGNLLFTTVAGTMCLADWHQPSPTQLCMLLGVGVVGGLAQFALFEGARSAPASVMATVEYSGLLWAFIFGYAVFGDVPRPPVFIGAGMIVCAGFLLVWIERAAGRRGAERGGLA